MRRPLRAVLHAALISLSICVAASARPAMADEADDLFHEAGKLYDDGKYEDAYQKYLRAWDERKSMDIAANLAQSEMKTGRRADAAMHLAYAIRTLTTSVAQDKRKALQDAYDGLVKELCVLYISSNVDGASVMVDGKSRGQAPLEDAVVVEPGHHVVTAELAEHESTPVPIDAVAGGAKSVKLELRPKKDHTVPLPEASRPVAPAIVGFALAGVGLGVGIGTLVAANGEDLTSCVATHTCDDPKSTKNALSNASVWTFVAGGALAAASTGYLIWAVTGPKAPSTGRAATTWSIVPVIAPSNLGLLVAKPF